MSNDNTPTVAAVPAHWQPIETAPKGRLLLVGYFNRAGKWRSVRGCYYDTEELESEVSESGWAPEGWYEQCDNAEEINFTDEPPTHWMPLPAAPGAVAAVPAEPAAPGSWAHLKVMMEWSAHNGVLQLDDALRNIADFSRAAPQATPPAPEHVPEATFGNIEATPSDAEVAALGYATNLAVAIHAKHYPEVTQWKPLDTVLGLLTQIDNMTCGLVQPSAPPAAPAHAPAPVNQELLAALKMARQELDDLPRSLGYSFTHLPKIDAAITRAESGAPAPAPQPLTDEQIQAILTAAVKEGRLSWLGFEKDEAGYYTRPSLSPGHYQLARAIERALGITGGATGGKP